MRDNIFTANHTLFEVVSNDTNFRATPDPTSATSFFLNFAGSLFYNINNAHQYVVQLTVYDSGIPRRSSTAIVIVPIINCNCHAPSYTAPAVLVAAITFEPNRLLGILNAWDIDGDRVTYSLDPLNNATVLSTIQVNTPNFKIKISFIYSLLIDNLLF